MTLGPNWHLRLKKCDVTDAGPQLTTTVKRFDVSEAGPQLAFWMFRFLQTPRRLTNWDLVQPEPNLTTQSGTTGIVGLVVGPSG